MKGFFTFISIFILLTTNCLCNVFTRNSFKISKSVLNEIKTFKESKETSSPKNFSSLKKNLNVSIQSQCFKLKEKLNGVIFSPTKLFPAQFINGSDTFFRT